MTTTSHTSNGHSSTAIVPAIDPPEAPKLPALKKPPRASPPAPAGKQKLILIPPIRPIETTVEISGISPLILHAWSEKAKRLMREKQQKLASEGREAKDPDADFQGARYIDAEGRDCVPAVALKACAVEAGVMCGVFKTQLRKAFFIKGELIPIISDAPTMREDMVRLSSGVADIRYRPEYRNWSIKIPVEFIPRLISAEQLFNLFDNAGYSVGLGEWRPERDGQFGRFRVSIP